MSIYFYFENKFHFHLLRSSSSSSLSHKNIYFSFGLISSKLFSSRIFFYYLSSKRQQIHFGKFILNVFVLLCTDFLGWGVTIKKSFWWKKSNKSHWFINLFSFLRVFFLFHFRQHEIRNMTEFMSIYQNIMSYVINIKFYGIFIVLLGICYLFAYLISFFLQRTSKRHHKDRLLNSRIMSSIEEKLYLLGRRRRRVEVSKDWAFDDDFTEKLSTFSSGTDWTKKYWW